MRYHFTLMSALTASLVGCTSMYVSGAPGPIEAARIVDVHPDRPRYRYRPASPALKLHARQIEVRVIDGSSQASERRDAPEQPVLLEATGEEPIEVSLHRDFDKRIGDLLAGYADGAPTAPLLTFYVQVDRVLAWNHEEQRLLAVKLTLGIESDDGVQLNGGRGSAHHDITGAAYDRAELDEIHLGTCLEAVEQALSERAIQSINEHLSRSAAAPPPPEQT